MKNSARLFPSRLPNSWCQCAISLTSLTACALLFAAGCAKPTSTEIDLGEIYVKSSNTADLTPGDPVAMKRLAEEIKGHPELETFTIKWKNSFPGAKAFWRELTYDRKAGEVVDDSEGVARVYSGVKNDMIFSLAQSGNSADALPAVGAKYVPPK